MADMAKTINLDKVVHIIPPDEYELPEPQLTLEPDPVKRYCPHAHVRIYQHYRVIKCADCQATLDPFDFLVQKGQQEQCAFSNIKMLHWEKKRKEEEIENLKKEISKLKAQKRKL